MIWELLGPALEPTGTRDDRVDEGEPRPVGSSFCRERDGGGPQFGVAGQYEFTGGRQMFRHLPATGATVLLDDSQLGFAAGVV